MLLKICLLVLSLLAIAYLGAIGFAYCFADQMIFPVVPSSYERLPDLQTVETSEGDTIAVVYLPVEGSQKLLLYSHGNGEDLGSIWPILKMYQSRGIAVLAYDYPGYGLSSGRASEKSVLAAADSVFQYATAKLGYRTADIVLYGRSLGSGPSTWLTTRYPVQGLILEGAFSSTFRVMTRFKILPFDTFDNLPLLRASRCPVLVLHGEKDLTVPFEHGHALIQAAGERGQHLWLPEAGHNDIISVAGPLYWETVLPFIEEGSNSVQP